LRHLGKHNEVRVEPLDAISEFVSAPENADSLQKKYDQYKELFEESENKVEEIIKFDPVKCCQKLRSIDFSSSKNSFCFQYVQEALRELFTIKETSFIEKGESFFVNINPFGATPSHELARDLLQKEEIALKVFQRVYSLEDDHKEYDSFDIEDLPYIANDISAKAKDDKFVSFYLGKRFERFRGFVESAINCRALTVYNVAGKKSVVERKELLQWLISKRQECINFPVCFEWLKDEERNAKLEKRFTSKKELIEEMGRVVRLALEENKIHYDVPLFIESIAICLNIKLVKNRSRTVYNNKGIPKAGFSYNTIYNYINTYSIKTANKGRKNKEDKVKREEIIKQIENIFSLPKYNYLRDGVRQFKNDQH
jgi:hypothetical protein